MAQDAYCLRSNEKISRYICVYDSLAQLLICPKGSLCRLLYMLTSFVTVNIDMRKYIIGRYIISSWMYIHDCCCSQREIRSCRIRVH